MSYFTYKRHQKHQVTVSEWCLQAEGRSCQIFVFQWERKVRETRSTEECFHCVAVPPTWQCKVFSSCCVVSWIVGSEGWVQRPGSPLDYLDMQGDSIVLQDATRCAWILPNVAEFSGETLAVSLLFKWTEHCRRARSGVSVSVPLFPAFLWLARQTWRLSVHYTCWTPQCRVVREPLCFLSIKMFCLCCFSGLVSGFFLSLSLCNNWVKKVVKQNSLGMIFFPFHPSVIYNAP